ncbi:MAG: hypothetical protein FWD61_07835 [Phycisphaerales bacterium]|nr:hypothetical protein [Phycisphaerales bacterium]
MMMLAFTPLIDPLTALYPGMSDYWLLLALPLVVAISVVYKGTRIKHLRQLPREAIILSMQIILLMVVAAAILGGLYWAWIRVV